MRALLVLYMVQELLLPGHIENVAGMAAARSAIESLAGPDPVALVFPVIAFTLSGISFMWTWPTVLALVSRRAPEKISGLMMAVVYLSAFVTGIGSGFVAGWYEAMGATNFWIMHMLMSLTGSIIVLLFGSSLKRAMKRLDGEAKFG